MNKQSDNICFLPLTRPHSVIPEFRETCESNEHLFFLISGTQEIVVASTPWIPACAGMTLVGEITSPTMGEVVRRAGEGALSKSTRALI